MSEEQPAAEAPVETPTPEAAPAETPSNDSVWYDAAEDEVKGYIQNKGWDDPIKAVKSYQELEKFRGASEDQLLKLPKDMQDAGAMDAIYDKLGRPESPDKYEVNLEGVEVDKGRLDYYADVAHKAGISQAQFEQIVKADSEFWANAEGDYNKQQAAAQEAEYKALIKEWGGNAAEREELSRRGMRSLLPKDMNADEVASKIEQAIGTAATLKLFANAGEAMSKEASIHDSSGDKPFGYTREQALADKKQILDEIKADPQRLANYNKAIGPDVDRMKKLNNIIAS